MSADVTTMSGTKMPMRRKFGLRFGFAAMSALTLSACGILSDPATLWPAGPGASGRASSETHDTGAGKKLPDRGGPLGQRAANNTLLSETIDRGTGQFTSNPIQTGSIGATATAAGVTVNLLNVPIAHAAKVILGDVLKLNYVVSDKVTGTVTIQTTNPMQKDALVDVFEAVLKSNGASIIRSEGFYKVVPAASVQTTGVPVSAQNRRSEPGIEAHIISLQYVSAAEMKRVIEPIAAQGSILRVDETRNLLVVSGTTRELKDIASMVALFDVDWMRGMSFGLIPVKTSNPESITKELDTIYGLDRDGPH
jgi:general secretion pathway protein D